MRVFYHQVPLDGHFLYLAVYWKQTTRHEEVKEMTITERMVAESQVDNLLRSIDRCYGTAICESMITLHGGSAETLGSWELEALRDDLVTIDNDR